MSPDIEIDAWCLVQPRGKEGDLVFVRGPGGDVRRLAAQRWARNAAATALSRASWGPRVVVVDVCLTDGSQPLLGQPSETYRVETTVTVTRLMPEDPNTHDRMR